MKRPTPFSQQEANDSQEANDRKEANVIANVTRQEVESTKERNDVNNSKDV